MLAIRFYNPDKNGESSARQPADYVLGFYGYLATIFDHEWIRISRRETRRPDRASGQFAQAAEIFVMDIPDPSADDSCEATDREEFLKILNVGLAKLTPDQREAWLLVRIHDHSRGHREDPRDQSGCFESAASTERIKSFEKNSREGG